MVMNKVAALPTVHIGGVPAAMLPLLSQNAMPYAQGSDIKTEALTIAVSANLSCKLLASVCQYHRLSKF